jgi:hypothetical protein
MSGGYAELVVNPNERAVSIDIMRLQRFKGADLAELWRAMIDTSFGTEDLDGSGAAVQVTTQTSPISGEVLGGLVVQPQVGVLDVLVAPGVAYVLDPDSPQNPDESLDKFVRDPGISTTGVLQMTGNTSGQFRCDVIECARVAGGYNVVETDNRDIFSTVTGLFTATTVNKVTQGAFQYRVRQGTPGDGFPGPSQGWMPLAVVSVPNGATTNDQMTFWDVRPLIVDRIRQPFAVSRDFSPVDRIHAQVDVGTYAGKAVLTGWVDCSPTDLVVSGTSPGRHRLGGRLRTGSTAADLVNTIGLPDGLDLNAAANQSGTWTAGQMVYLYVLEPFSLPRWVRYTDSSTGSRKPRGPRGMLLVSPVAPTAFYGCPSAAITLPASWGLAGSTSKGVCILALVGQAGQKVAPLIADGRKVSMGGTTGAGTIADYTWVATVDSTSAGIVGGTLQVVFDLVDGTTHPPNAKAIDVLFQVPDLAVTASSESAVLSAAGYVSNAGGILANFDVAVGPAVLANVTSDSTLWMRARIPLPLIYPAGTPPARTITLNIAYLNYTYGGGANGCTMYVSSYDA